MKRAGRNDPCPCGSGRKFKDCCSGDSAARFAAQSASTIRESSISKLLAFAFQPTFDSDHAVAEVIFWGQLLRDLPPHEVQWLLESEDANIKYNAWFLFDWELDGQGTATDLFLEDPQTRLKGAERDFISRLTEAHLRLYEVESVDRGHGVRLLDLWSGERSFVLERTATAHIATWDLLGARVADDGLGGRVFEGGVYLYPAEVKPEVVAHFRRLHRRYQRKHPTHTSRAFFRNNGMVFHHLWLRLVAFPDPPQLVTSEGDVMMFCRVVFDAPQAAAVRKAIADRPDVRATGDGALMWLETSGETERVIGTWTFQKRRIVLETTSQERAARGRAWLEALAGERVRYRATALETVEHAMKDLRRGPSKSSDPGPPPDTDYTIVRELYDRHYASWLDQPVPALGNRTPRAAAQLKLWRPRLLDLLKQFENSAERAALQGRPAYDFSWIWKELKIDRPGTPVPPALAKQR